MSSVPTPKGQSKVRCIVLEGRQEMAAGREKVTRQLA